MNYYTKAVVDLVKEVGVSRLVGYDGCFCGQFEVRSVKVDIACGKGRDRAIWIWSHNDDFYDSEYKLDTEALRPIAEEVAKQVEEADCRGPLPVHYREWNKDLDR
jgi:hypothetical protein